MNKTKPTDGRTEERSSSQEELKSGDSAKPFYTALAELLPDHGLTLEMLLPEGEDTAIARRVLEDYGAMFVAATSIVAPPTCLFRSAEEVLEFQLRAGFRAEMMGGDRVELQPAAMEALLEARREAQHEGLDITPRDGAEAARRSYADTLR